MKFNQQIPYGNIIYVDGSRTDYYTPDGSQNFPYKTINSALTIATNGKTILINPATYSENVAGSTLINKNLNITGIDKDTCIIAGYVFAYQNASQATIINISNLTINTPSGATPFAYAGTTTAYSQSCYLKNCKIISNDLTYPSVGCVNNYTFNLYMYECILQSTQSYYNVEISTGATINLYLDRVTLITGNANNFNVITGNTINAFIDNDSTKLTHADSTGTLNKTYTSNEIRNGSLIAGETSDDASDTVACEIKRIESALHIDIPVLQTKLESSTDITTPTFGNSGVYSFTSEGSFTTGKFGNALFNTPSTDSQGFFQNVFPTVCRGSVECWIQIPYPSSTPTRSYIHQNTLSSFFIELTFDGELYSAPLVAKATIGGLTVQSTTDFYLIPDVWTHVAYSWDIYGINGTTKTLAIYVNDVEEASTTTALNITTTMSDITLKPIPSAEYTYMGVDNFIAWANPKTSFNIISEITMKKTMYSSHNYITDGMSAIEAISELDRVLYNHINGATGY